MVALKDGDIVFAQFKHQEGPVMAKVRPVMIVDVTPFGIEVIYGSSQQIAQALPWEFIIPENEIELVFLKRITRFDFKHRDILTPNLDDKRVWAHQGPIGNIRSLSRGTQAQIFKAFRESGMLRRN